MNNQKHLRSDTKNRIMDAAERLFAIKGFQGTSIKRLACDARVNQVAVNYYFGSKAVLIEKVIDRRLWPTPQAARPNRAGSGVFNKSPGDL